MAAPSSWCGPTIGCAPGGPRAERSLVLARRLALVEHILPSLPGRRGMVIISPAALPLDALTGHSLWMGQAPLVEIPAQFEPELLDPGDLRGHRS